MKKLSASSRAILQGLPTREEAYGPLAAEVGSSDEEPPKATGRPAPYIHVPYPSQFDLSAPRTTTMGVHTWFSAHANRPTTLPKYGEKKEKQEEQEKKQREEEEKAAEEKSRRDSLEKQKEFTKKKKEEKDMKVDRMLQLSVGLSVTLIIAIGVIKYSQCL